MRVGGEREREAEMENEYTADWTMWICRFSWKDNRYDVSVSGKKTFYETFQFTDMKRLVVFCVAVSAPKVVLEECSTMSDLLQLSNR